MHKYELPRIYKIKEMFTFVECVCELVPSECTSFEREMESHHRLTIDGAHKSKEETKTFEIEKTDKCQWPIIIIMIQHAMLSIIYIQTITWSSLMGRLKSFTALGVHHLIVIE